MWTSSHVDSALRAAAAPPPCRRPRRPRRVFRPDVLRAAHARGAAPADTHASGRFGANPRPPSTEAPSRAPTLHTPGGRLVTHEARGITFRYSPTHGDTGAPPACACGNGPSHGMMGLVTQVHSTLDGSVLVASVLATQTMSSPHSTLKIPLPTMRWNSS